ncbi:TetR/AcrR family transcriptional regulator [Nocardioides salsibiostraticola]
MPHLIDPTLTRRERQRESTYVDIVAASRELLAESPELSLRAVAANMGMTAPALYRYVANHQELVDLVAFEIDKAATETFAAAAAAMATDDAPGRLVAATTEFRQWALGNPNEFAIVFANPTAEAACVRRELITLASSGHLLTDLIHDVWTQRGFAIPDIDDLPAAVREALEEPLIPAKVEHLSREERGLVWVFMQAWTQLYGVVALEVMGHMDPRVIESGEMFIDVVRRFAPTVGLVEEMPRLERIIRARLAR